jgi:4-hydroxy-tetrahydrodipicolinate reductase
VEHRDVGRFAPGASSSIDLGWSVWVHDPKKAGHDAGALCGLPPTTGVKATNDVDALLALDADCVCYTATADLRPFEAIEEICRILAAGMDVVSTSLVPLVHPKTFIDEVRDKLAAACAKGGTSFFTSGIDPGFANDTLPLVLTGLSERWHEVRCLEIINYTTYDQPQVLFETMGSRPLDHTPILLAPGTWAS